MVCLTFQRPLLIGVLALLAVGGLPAFAADWPQYRGPHHNGISTETIRTNWTAEPPVEVWRQPASPALSSLAIAGGRVYTLGRRAVADAGDREHVIALDAATGQELWATDFDRASYPNGGVGNGSDDGPRSTPTVDGDFVYAFGAYLRLVCLRAHDGSLVWERDFAAELGSPVIAWQNAASPLLAGDRIFVNANAATGRLLAIDKTDGTTLWQSGPTHQMTQATPILATVDGVEQVIFFAQSGLVGVAPATGEVLWHYPFSYSTSTAASPVAGEGMVYCSAAYGSGAGVVRPAKQGDIFTASEVWRRRGDHQNHWATPILWEGHLYGHYNQSFPDLQCINLATGNETWPQPVSGFGYGSILVVGGNLLLFAENGTLALAQPDPAQYREIARYKALTGRCWNAPAVSNGRIYLRSTLEVACLDVALPRPPLPPLVLQPAVPDRTLPFRFQVAAEDGTPVSAEDLAETTVLATPDPSLPLDQWTRLQLTPSEDDGTVFFEDLESTNLPTRHYLVQPQNP